MKIRVTTILAASGLIALGACTDPSLNGGTSGAGTGPGGLSRTQQGALAGAAIGGVIGYVNDKDDDCDGYYGDGRYVDDDCRDDDRYARYWR